MTEQLVPTLCPHLLMKGLRGGEEMPKRGKVEKERSRATPCVGTRPHPLPQHPSFHTTSGARCFLADLTHYTSTLFLNALSKQKQALLEMCISPSKSPDTQIIHFLTLFSDPSLSTPSLPASSYLQLIYRLPVRRKLIFRIMQGRRHTCQIKNKTSKQPLKTVPR